MKKGPSQQPGPTESQELTPQPKVPSQGKPTQTQRPELQQGTQSQIMMTLQPNYKDLEGIKSLGSEYKIIATDANSVVKYVGNVVEALRKDLAGIVNEYNSSLEKLKETAEYKLSEWIEQVIGPKIDAVVDMYNRKLGAIDKVIKEVSSIRDKYKRKEIALKAIENIKDELGENMYLALKKGIEALKRYNDVLSFLNESKGAIKNELVRTIDDIVGSAINTMTPVFDYIPVLVNGTYIERTKENIENQMNSIYGRIKETVGGLKEYAISKLKELVYGIKTRIEKLYIVKEAFSIQGNELAVKDVEERLQKLEDTKSYLEKLLT